MISLTVNGKRHELDVDEDVPFIYVLRNTLGLASVKFGCGLEQCGACKVLADGVPVHTCVAATASFAGRLIETVEGMAGQVALHPVQTALQDANAAQCGYCLSGILLAAKALFERNPHPSRDDIRAALDDHLCRCGAHPRMLDALERLARRG